MSRNLISGRIHLGFKSLAIPHRFARLAVPLLCGLALLLPAAPARAAIALVDNETQGSAIAGADTTSAYLTLLTNLTVSATANTLVVEVATRNNTTAPNWPSTLSWTNATTVNTLNLAVGKFSQSASGGRDVMIYYCYSPTSGAGFNIRGLPLSGSITNASGTIVAFTLSGVDTTASPLVNSGASQSGSSIAFNIAGVTANSWAAVAGDIATQTGTQTITGTGGTVTPYTIQFLHTSTASLGYISTVSGGSDTFTYAYTTSGGNQSFAAAVFAPPSLPAIASQPQSTSVFAGGNAQFSVAATGTSISYQWYSTTNTTLPMTNDLALTGATKYSGTTASTLIVSNVTASDLTNYAVVITGSSVSVTSSIVNLTYWPSTPTLQLRMPFTNNDATDISSTNAGSDTSSGGIALTMSMYTNSTTYVDLHGAPGTGITISNPNAIALDMTTNTAVTQTNEPVESAPNNNSTVGAIVDVTNSTTLATLGGANSGNISNFTATLWIKQAVPYNSTVGVGPRLWVLSAGASGSSNGSCQYELSQRDGGADPVGQSISTGLSEWRKRHFQLAVGQHTG
jgi:hypothetical protein